MPTTRDPLTEQVRKEMAAWPPRPELWAHAQSCHVGDEEKTRDLYLKMRVAELRMAEQVQDAPPPDRADRDAPQLASLLASRPVSSLGRWLWDAVGRIVGEMAPFNLTIGAFVSVLTFTSIYLNALGSRAWWILLPLGQVCNMYLSYRLSGFPLHLLAPSRLARARLEILMHVFTLTALLVLLALAIPLAGRFIR